MTHTHTHTPIAHRAHRFAASNGSMSTTVTVTPPQWPFLSINIKCQFETSGSVQGHFTFVTRLYVNLPFTLLATTFWFELLKPRLHCHCRISADSVQNHCRFSEESLQIPDTADTAVAWHRLAGEGVC